MAKATTTVDLQLAWWVRHVLMLFLLGSLLTKRDIPESWTDWVLGHGVKVVKQ